MKKLFIISFLSLAVIFYSFTTKAAFVEGMEDIPIAPDLEQIQKNNFSFGNEETRIIEAYFSSKKTNYAKVESFYLDTLAQLGWTFMGKNKNKLIFKRNNEELNVITEKKNPLIVRVTLTGKP